MCIWFYQQFSLYAIRISKEIGQFVFLLLETRNIKVEHIFKIFFLNML